MSSENQMHLVKIKHWDKTKLCIEKDGLVWFTFSNETDKMLWFERIVKGHEHEVLGPVDSIEDAQMKYPEVML